MTTSESAGRIGDDDDEEIAKARLVHDDDTKYSVSTLRE